MQVMLETRLEETERVVHDEQDRPVVLSLPVGMI